MSIRIPRQLADAVDEDDRPARVDWLLGLPEQVKEVACEWELEVGDPYVPGGQCAWVAPARNRAGDWLVLKVGWRHREAEHEADALRFWDGDGAIRCFASQTVKDTSALLLERCVSGIPLGSSLPEPEQDVVLARLLRRLWEREPPDGHPFGSLRAMSDQWADEFEVDFESDHRGLDPGLAREGITALRELPGTSDRRVLLCADLHAGNVLAAQRESWLVIDPKPFVGEPAYDAVQHMLNCGERLGADPAALSRRMAGLLGLDPDRVQSWLFARCTQEALHDVTLREPARRLAP